MNLSQLTHDEQVTLIGLVRLMVQLDEKYGEEEASALGTIREELGAERLAGLIEEAAEKMETREQVQHYAGLVARTEARELMYGTLFDVAAAGTIVAAESELLEWLGKTWQIKPVVEDEAPQ